MVHFTARAAGRAKIVIVVGWIEVCRNVSDSSITNDNIHLKRLCKLLSITLCHEWHGREARTVYGVHMIGTYDTRADDGVYAVRENI